MTNGRPSTTCLSACCLLICPRCCLRTICVSFIVYDLQVFIRCSFRVQCHQSCDSKTESFFSVVFFFVISRPKTDIFSRFICEKTTRTERRFRFFFRFFRFRFAYKNPTEPDRVFGENPRTDRAFFRFRFTTLSVTYLTLQHAPHQLRLLGTTMDQHCCNSYTWRAVSRSTAWH